ncbi:MAG: hypothetical protein RL139_578 [Gemmatimonadota bacterium]|jgi:hypothetical protein
MDLRLLRPVLLGITVLGLAGPRGASAQRAEEARAGVSRPIEAPESRRSGTGGTDAREETVDAGPISPRRAFLYSFLLPGAGQARLDRGRAGGMFFLIEVAALTLVHRSAEDLRIARTYAGDSIPLRYQTDAATGLAARDASGRPVVAAWSVPRYTDAYVRTRRLHYEDWLAVMAFNHLFAGADAFVAAQLWDLPARVGVSLTPQGPRLEAAFRTR